MSEDLIRSREGDIVENGPTNLYQDGDVYDPQKGDAYLVARNGYWRRVILPAKDPK
jgi:hypothetical protein